MAQELAKAAASRFVGQVGRKGTLLGGGPVVITPKKLGKTIQDVERILFQCSGGKYPP